MDTVQYFKIHNLLNLIREEYVKIETQRSHEDRNNSFSSLIGEYHVEMGGDFKTVSSMVLVQTGGEKRFKENQIIRNVEHIYDSLNHLTLKLSNEKYIEFKEKLIDYYLKIKSFVSCSNTVIKINGKMSNEQDEVDELIIREKIEYELETLQLDEMIIDSDVEVKANEMKELGNKQFKEGNFIGSIGSFSRALRNFGLSNLTKSILYSNMGLAIYSRHGETQKKFTENCEKVTNSLDDYYEILDAHKNVMKSIESRPSWFKPYYLLAKIRSKLSNYQQSINLCDAALYLLQTTPPPNLTNDSISSMKLEIEKIRLNSINKLGQFVIKENGERDFKQESINKLGAGGILIRLFGGKSITNELIVKHGLDKHDEGNDEFINSLEGTLKYERIAINKAKEYENNGLNDDAYELYSALIGGNTQFSLAYLNFFRFLDNHKNAFFVCQPSDNLLLCFTLLLKAVTMKQYAITHDSKIYGESILMSLFTYKEVTTIFGSIYKSGLFNQDIDIEKSLYYFGQCAKDAEKFLFGQYDGYAHLLIANLYLYGIISNQSILSSTISSNRSRSKAEQYLLKGAQLGSVSCRQFYENIDFILESD